MAGLAFSQAGLGLCHALSHALGGAFHVPHGRLNAILLPAVLEVNQAGAQRQYAELSRYAGCGGSADLMAVRNLKNNLLKLRKQLGLPGSLRAAGVDCRELRSREEAIVQAALEDPCCSSNPVPVDGQTVKKLLREVADGG